MECHSGDTGSCVGCVRRNSTIRPKFEVMPLLANSQGAATLGQSPPKKLNFEEASLLVVRVSERQSFP